MTRINVVPVAELSRQHLVAEYRELPRIYNLVRSAIDAGRRPNCPKLPTTYRLGTGHCLFFYNKLGWLHARQAELISQMLERGYTVNFPLSDISDIPSAWHGWFLVTPEALALNRARILERS